MAGRISALGASVLLAACSSLAVAVTSSSSQILPTKGAYQFRSAIADLYLAACQNDLYAVPLPTTPDASFSFNILPALSGADGAISLESKETPGSFLAVVDGGSLAMVSSPPG